MVIDLAEIWDQFDKTLDDKLAPVNLSTLQVSGALQLPHWQNVNLGKTVCRCQTLGPAFLTFVTGHFSEFCLWPE